VWREGEGYLVQDRLGKPLAGQVRAQPRMRMARGSLNKQGRGKEGLTVVKGAWVRRRVPPGQAEPLKAGRETQCRPFLMRAHGPRDRRLRKMTPGGGRARGVLLKKGAAKKGIIQAGKGEEGPIKKKSQTK